MTVDDTVRQIVNHPAFKGFSRLLLPRASNTGDDDTVLRQVGSLMPYHGQVNPDIVVGALNRIIDEVKDGKTVLAGSRRAVLGKKFVCEVVIATLAQKIRDSVVAKQPNRKA